MKSKPKVFKLFYDEDSIKRLPNFDLVFAIPEPYPFFDHCYKLKEVALDVGKIINLAEECLIKNPDIEGVLVIFDFEALVTFGVLGKFENLKVKVPNFESALLCNHKLYQRLNDNDPIKFSYIDLNDENWESNNVNLPNFPFFFKPPQLCMSLQQYLVNDMVSLREIISNLRKELNYYTNDFQYLSKAFLDLEKYPLATKNIMICEELISDALQVNWEGWCDNEGNIKSYCFIDEVLASPAIFSDFIIPSKHSPEILNKIEKVCFDYLKKINFKNGFVNIELWILKNGSIKIIEVNPRSAFPNFGIYQKTYGVNLFNDIIDCSAGKEISTPLNMEIRSYCSQTVFATKLNGKMSELINYENIEIEKEKNPNYWWFFLINDPNFIITDNTQIGGRVLLVINIFKNSYLEIEEESFRLKKLFLRKDDYYYETFKKN